MSAIAKSDTALDHLPPWAVTARILIATVLLIASFLKLWTLSSDSNFTLLKIQMFSVALFELIFGGWLLFRRWTSTNLVVTFVTFGIFLSIAGNDVLEKRVSCRCFGSLNVPPIFSVFLDLSILFVICTLIQIEMLKSTGLKAVIRAALVIFPVGGAIMLSAGFQHESTNHTEILDPQSWLGSEVPDSLLAQDEHVYMHGCWLLVFYDPICSECTRVKKLLAKYQNPHLAETKLNVAFINVTSQRSVIEGHQTFHLLKAESRFIAVPTVLITDQGRVRTVVQDRASLTWLEQTLDEATGELLLPPG